MITKIVLSIAILTSPQVAPAATARQQPPRQQPCAADAAPTPEHTARRREGVRLTRTINNLQVNQPGAREKKYLEQQELGTSAFATRQTGASAEFHKSLNFTPGAELSPGWTLTLDLTSTGYWFMIRDKTDPCGLTFISSQDGLIFEARPIR